MAFGKIKPKKASADVLKEISQQAQEQRYFVSVPRSEDPENFPVFGLGNESYLVYVPNLTTLDEEGREALLCDKPWIHSLQDHNRYHKVRCGEGIESEALGLDGTCPICDSLEVVNELAQLEADKLLVSQGFQAGDTSDEAKKITSGIYQNRIIKRKQQHLTFPIAVFERTSSENPKTGRKVYEFVLDEDGKPKYQLMWYSISDALYTGTDSTAGKWKPELERRSEELDEDILTPAGLWFTLKGDYAKDSQKWNARDAARNFSVSMINGGPKGLDEDTIISLEEEIDESAKEWTPDKAIEMVIAKHFLPVEDVQASVDELLQPVRDKIEIHKLGSEVGELPAIETSAPKKGQDKLLALDGDDIDDLED